MSSASASIADGSTVWAVVIVSTVQAASMLGLPSPLSVEWALLSMKKGVWAVHDLRHWAVDHRPH